ncbi:MAG TPA: PAS domain S-box protein [Sphingobacteriaceae bacterium]
MAEPMLSNNDKENFKIITTYIPKELLNKLPFAIYTCNADGYIESFNDAAVELWGRSPEIGKDLWCGSWKIVNDDGTYRELTAYPMARTLWERTKIEAEEILIERPDGTRRYLIAHPEPIFNSSGSLIGAVNTLVDITEQKNSEEKHAMLAAIIESSVDAIISKTLKGIITSWNIGAEQIFGYSESEVIGKHISILIPPNRIQEENIIINNIKSGNRVEHFETIRIAKNGREIPISLTVSPIKNSRGQIIGASKIARDITIQNEARQKLHLYNKQLEKINSYKDEFIGMASHELKTPLTSVNLYLQMLQRSETNEQNKKFITQSVSQLNKLNCLVSDLLDVSKIQSGKLLLRPASFEVNELIYEVAKIMQETNNSHFIEIENDLTNRKFIIADKHRLEQVMINLLTNAIKYSPNSDRIVVSVIDKVEKIKISITDFGIGVPEDQQEKIFTRFYRIEELGPSYSGLGIGLYISSEIITSHGGHLWVESIPGKGSTFSFEIPITQ